jgi:putative peptidoglycan lipid II flippase
MHLLVGTALASFLAPGSISALYFAERLLELPHGLAGVAVGLASLPRLSAQAAHREPDDFSRTLSDGLRLSAFLSLPAAAGLFTLALPLTDLLFGHGAFLPEQAACTAAALRIYSLGLPAVCAARPLMAAVFALGLERVPLQTACLSLAILLPVSLAGMRLFGNSPAGAVAGLALGLSAGAWCNAALLLRRLRNAGITCPVHASRRSLAAYMTGALIMGGALSLAGGQAGSLPPGVLLLLTGACAGLWTGAFYAANNTDARSLLALLRVFRPRAG